MAKVINARSPFIVTVNALTENVTSVELRFKKFSSPTYPTNPDYVLSKTIPANNQTITKYNISPYIREYIDNNKPWQLNSSYNTGGGYLLVDMPEGEYIMLRVTIYRGNQGVSNTEYFATDGWGYFEQGENPDFEQGGTGNKGNVLLSEGTYYYWSKCTETNTAYVTNPYYRFPLIPIKPNNDWEVRTTNLDSNTTNTTSLSTYADEMVLAQLGIDYRYKYKVEIRDVSLSPIVLVVWTGYFYPQTESKYDVICCDFINKFGAWQRTWFFKASRSKFDVMQEEYKGLDGVFDPYNTNGTKSITVNTGWVEEEYNETTLKQLAFSERILINGERVKLKSKSIDLKKHINDKTINYTMEFDYSYDVLNTISL